MHILFRFHRGSLEESLKTTITVSSLEDLLFFGQESLILREAKLEDLKCKKYAFDKRIGWDTYIVLCKGEPIGFSNHELF